MANKIAKARGKQAAKVVKAAGRTYGVKRPMVRKAAKAAKSRYTK
jgi:hypothetical protein